MEFKGKTVLVTGASRGIGRAVAEMFACHGAQVIGTSTSKEGIQKISGYLGSSGQGLLLNVNDKASIESAMHYTLSEFGSIDILINNAGILRDNLLIKMKEKDWEEVIQTNLTSLFYLSKAVTYTMIKKHYGRIISLGSVIGLMGNAGQTNYAAAKAGLIGFSKSLAREVASRGITVNVVAPGFITTDMTSMLTQHRKANILDKIPLGRFGDPKEVAYAVAFLASEKASYITGETLNISGGIYMV